SALATASVPVLPLAPGLFSTMNVCRTRLCRSSAINRAGGERHDDFHRFCRPDLSGGQNRAEQKQRCGDKDLIHFYSFNFPVLGPTRIMPICQDEAEPEAERMPCVPQKHCEHC